MRSVAARLVWYWGPLALYAAAIFALSAMSHPPVPRLSFPHADKLAHLIEYAGFGALMCRALAMGGEGLAPRVAFYGTVLIATLYGATDELHQAFVPNREPSMADLLADMAGAALGAFVYRIFALREREDVHKVRASSGEPPSP
jgi:VanZ family protein